MKKFMRIALVFALAGATLVGCTKDYSGDISDLNKKVSEQATALSALQTQVGAAQTAADAAAQKAAEALAEAQKKATPADVQAAEERVNAKINDLVNGDVKSLKDAVAALEGIKADEKLTALETAIKDFVTKAEFAQELTALKDELTAAIAAGDKVNADAIAELTEKVGEILAKADEAALTIYAPANAVIVNFDHAAFNPNTDDTNYKALAKAFPEIKEIKKGTEISQGGHVPFAASSTTVEFDDEWDFALVNPEGEAYPAVAGNPQKGIVGLYDYNSWYIETKGATAYWTVDLNPATVEKEFVEGDALALVATKGENSYATQFVYSIDINQVRQNIVINANDATADYAEKIDLFGFKKGSKTDKIVSFTNEMEGIYTIEAESSNANQLLIEKYGVSFDGHTVSVAKYPEDKRSISFEVTVKALGLNGSAASKNFTLTVTKPISADGKLAAKELVLNGKASYKVRWNLSDYDFTKAELAEFVGNDHTDHTLTFTYQYLDIETGKIETAELDPYNVDFYDEDGDPTADWSKAVTFGFNINEEAEFTPDEYAVEFVVAKDGGQTTVYAAESTFTVTNDEKVIGDIKLLDSVCDENGVLLAVGSSNENLITYNFENAFVIGNDHIAVIGYEDLEFNAKADEKGTVANYNWTPKGEMLAIPANGVKDAKKVEFNFVNNTVRNVRAYLSYFNDPANLGVFDFQVKVVSPIFSETVANVLTLANQTIYFTKSEGRANSFKLSDVVTKAVYAAGTKAGQPYSVFGEATPAVYYPAYDSPKYNDGFLADKDGKLVAFTKDELLAYKFITTEEWMKHAANAKFYVKKDGTVVKEGSSSTIAPVQWSFESGVADWNTNRTYNATNKNFDKKTEAEATEDKTITITNGSTGWWAQSITATIAVPKSKVASLESITTTLQNWVRANWYVRANQNAVASHFAEMTESIPAQVEVELLEVGKNFDAIKDKISLPVSTKWIKVEAKEGVRADEIAKVTVKFDDATKAAKFIVGPDFKWEDTNAVVTANQHYSPADLPGNQVTLGATITIADKWGKSIESPFTVTCKINN